MSRLLPVLVFLLAALPVSAAFARPHHYYEHHRHHEYHHHRFHHD